MARNPHPLSGSYRRLASGREVFIDDRGVATLVADEPEWDEGPTCSICDGLGHGYPGGGPCPLEEGDSWYVGSQEEARERYLEGLAEQAKADREDARDEAIEWGGMDIPS
jgi:hypothetical protein